MITAGATARPRSTRAWLRRPWFTQRRRPIPPAAVTYALTGTDAAAFTIELRGVVTINATPDFETKRSYSFNVKRAMPGQLHHAGRHPEHQRPATCDRRWRHGDGSVNEGWLPTRPCTRQWRPIPPAVR